MLNVDVTIRSIDYERTFEALFPLLMETVNNMDAENSMIRLLQRLGQTSRGVVTALLRRLFRYHQDELLCRLVNHYRVDICKQLNALIDANEMRGCVSAGRLSVQHNRDGMLLKLGSVQVNYAELLKDSRARQAIGASAENSGLGRLVQRVSSAPKGQLGKMVSDTVDAISQNKMTGIITGVFHNKIEKKTVKMLEKQYLPEELGELISEYLEGRGIYAEIDEVNVYPMESVEEQDIPERFLDKELEDALIDAVANYLRDCDQNMN